MRPRLITAENTVAVRAGTGVLVASMRPRLITAENDRAAIESYEWAVASMRPRLITAENGSAAAATAPTRGRFNEAAAHHRGERIGDRIGGLAEGVLQ